MHPLFCKLSLNLWIQWIVVVVLLLSAPLSALHACPACKDNIEQRANAKGAVATSYAELSSTEKAYSWTVLLLIAIPFSMATWLVRLFRRMHLEEKAKWAHLGV